MAFDKDRLMAHMRKVLDFEPQDESDDVSNFVRKAMRSKLEEDWERSKAKSGLTMDERAVLEEVYEGPHESWRWHLFHTDRVLWSFLTFGSSEDLEPLTLQEIIQGYPDYPWWRA